MFEFDVKLQELSVKCARKKKLEAELQDLYVQRRTLQDKTYNLKNEMYSEKADVDRLEGKNLYALFYYIIGKKDEMLSKETEEAYAAKIKYDTAKAELDAVLDDIECYIEELNGLKNCDTEYATVIKEKASYMKALGTKEAEEILNLEEQIRSLENIKREIQEAIAAGQRAKSITVSVLERLSKAKEWSTYDMIMGDGIISHVVKHNHLNAAQTNIEDLQVALRKFRTECADIKISADLKVKIDGFLGFADFFFDGLFADLAVRKRINNSLEEVQRISSQIATALQKLNRMYSEADNKLAVMRKRHNDIVIRA